MESVVWSDLRLLLVRMFSEDKMSWNCSLSLTRSVQLERMFLMFMDIFQFVEQMARIAELSRISDRFVVLTLGPMEQTL